MPVSLDLLFQNGYTPCLMGLDTYTSYLNIGVGALRLQFPMPCPLSTPFRPASQRCTKTTHDNLPMTFLHNGKSSDQLLVLVTWHLTYVDFDTVDIVSLSKHFFNCLLESSAFSVLLSSWHLSLSLYICLHVTAFLVWTWCSAQCTEFFSSPHTLTP